VRVVDVPGTGPQLLGNLRQVDALLVVLDGFSGTRVPADDLETLKLELLVADRDHVERGSSASRSRRSRATAVSRRRRRARALLAHLDAGRTLADWEGELPAELEPLTTKPLSRLVNGPDGIDLQLEAELAELVPEEAAEFRGGGESALGEVVRRLVETLDLITFFTAGDKETRAWTLRAARPRSTRPRPSTPTSRAGFIRCEVVRWDDLVEAGGHAEAARAASSASREDLRRRGRRRPQRPLQRLEGP
jgi:ribosome-binding ATPase YchF (GTP1/OBG family)